MAERVEPAPASEAWSSIEGFLAELHSRYAGLDRGDVATYIPELAKADPSWFGIALATTDGHIYEVGDSQQAFTIQSISKPFTYGMALEEFGPTKVFEHVGVEPSGDVFNSIELQNGSNRPYNPMINSGAITVTALLHARYGTRTFEYLLDRFSIIAGRQLSLDRSVYESERRTGHRNRAIAYLLLNFGLVHEEADAALDVYFRQCSIQVTCRDLAMMAGTLSNMGRHPVTGRSAYSITHVKDMLSIMFTCGMYDYSGQWAYRVGVPAKSGVSGGVLAVVNRQIGIATYSPRLDPCGNSCRGIEVCSDLASRLGLHVFDCLNVGSTFLDVVLGENANA
jgi:glutaminase